MVTMLLGLHALEVFEAGSLIVAMTVFAGALGSLAAAAIAASRHDTFLITSFGGLGLFWGSLAWILISTRTSDISTWDTPAAVGWYFVVWALFTGLLIAAGSRRSHLTVVVYGSLTVALLLFAGGAFTESFILTRFAGASAMAHSVIAFYGGAAVLVQSVFGRPVLPIGEVPDFVVPDTPASLMDW
jgi:succinate-acetate transporter protein